jgi:hypothetical protein
MPGVRKEKPKSAATEALSLLERYGPNYADKVRFHFMDLLNLNSLFAVQKDNSLLPCFEARNINANM